MGRFDSSWWLKIRRAEDRLRDLEPLITPYDRSRQYDVRGGVEGQSGRTYLYRAYTDVEVNPLIAVTVGELLFNLRSSLDHLAVALMPLKFRHKTYFPIFREDPTIDPEGGGDYGKRHQRNADQWEKFRANLDPGAFECILHAQPFRIDEPDAHALAILNGLNNADKHRELVGTVAALNPTLITVTDSIENRIETRQPLLLVANQMQSDGTPVHLSDHEVEVQAEGSIRVGVKGRGDSVYRVPDAFQRILRYVTKIAELLDPYTR